MATSKSTKGKSAKPKKQVKKQDKGDTGEVSSVKKPHELHVLAQTRLVKHRNEVTWFQLDTLDMPIHDELSIDEALKQLKTFLLKSLEATQKEQQKDDSYRQQPKPQSA